MSKGSRWLDSILRTVNHQALTTTSIHMSDSITMYTYYNPKPLRHQHGSKNPLGCRGTWPSLDELSGSMLVCRGVIWCNIFPLHTASRARPVLHLIVTPNSAVDPRFRVHDRQRACGCDPQPIYAHYKSVTLPGIVMEVEFTTCL